MILRSIIHLFSGFAFGIVLYKSEVISWFRIQKMFAFEEFHMYGVISTAIATGAVLYYVARKSGMKNLKQEEVNIRQKDPRLKRGLIGGVIFGLGWALTGACPGPVLVHVGSGATIFLVVFLMATIGAGVYYLLQDRLPH